MASTCSPSPLISIRCLRKWQPASLNRHHDGTARRTMRWILIVVGAVLDLLGIVWLLQGLNVLPGSFMTGQLFWAGAGLAMDILGMGLIVLGLRWRPASG